MGKSRHKPTTQHEKLLAATQDNNAKTLDSFTNYVAKLGLPADPLLNSANYSLDYSTRNRLFLEAAYRSSWIVQAVTNVVAEDATREGCEFQCAELDVEDHRVIEDTMERLQIWEAITENIRWSRLFGTSALVPLIDGQDMERELDLETIGAQQFKGVIPVDRWRLLPSVGQPITELGPNIGYPMYYKTTSDVMGIADQVIHWTRVMRFDAVQLPYYQWLAENTFGESIIEVLRDRLIAFDSVTMGAASLIFKAHLRTYKVEGLREILAGNQQALQGLQATLDTIRQWQSINGLTVIDASDEFDIQTYNFGGLADVMEKFEEQIAGACGIPVTRLFGTTPSGLNTDGASSLSTYYDNIRRLQERHLRKPLRRIIDMICRSELGQPLPDDFRITFKPLWQNDDGKKSEIAAKTTESVLKAYEIGLISQQQALRELKGTAGITGLFGLITDEEIAAAEETLPDANEMLNPMSAVNANNETQMNMNSENIEANKASEAAAASEKADA